MGDEAVTHYLGLNAADTIPDVMSAVAAWVRADSERLKRALAEAMRLTPLDRWDRQHDAGPHGAGVAASIGCSATR